MRARKRRKTRHLGVQLPFGLFGVLDGQDALRLELMEYARGETPSYLGVCPSPRLFRDRNTTTKVIGVHNDYFFFENPSHAWVPY